MEMWILSDDDSYQHVIRVEGMPSGYGDVFKLVEVADISSITGRSGSCVVVSGLVCLGDYLEDGFGDDETMNELNSILATYGYCNVDDVKTQYGDQATQIIAECVFETGGLMKNAIIFAGTKAECVGFINKSLISTGPSAA